MYYSSSKSHLLYCITYLRNTSASRKYFSEFRSKFAYNNISNTVSRMLRDRQDDSLSESTYNIILSCLIFIVPHFFLSSTAKTTMTQHTGVTYIEEVVLQLLRLLTLQNWLFSRYFFSYTANATHPTTHIL